MYSTEYSKNEKRQKREEKDFSAGIYLQLAERRVNIETRLPQLFLSLPSLPPPLLFGRSFARLCCAFGRLRAKQPIHTIHKKPLNSEARCRGERITELPNCYFFHFFSSYFHFYHATVAASHYHTIPATTPLEPEIRPNEVLLFSSHRHRRCCRLTFFRV